MQSCQLLQSPLHIVAVPPSYPPYSGGVIITIGSPEVYLSKIMYFITMHILPRKLRGREEVRCSNCCPSLAKRPKIVPPKMSVPELPPVEAPEEEVEEEVKITAEEMANMAVSNRPHTQVMKKKLFLTYFTFIESHPNQVDYIHHLVPDLCQITACSFYWGKMDRYLTLSMIPISRLNDLQGPLYFCFKV